MITQSGPYTHSHPPPTFHPIIQFTAVPPPPHIYRTRGPLGDFLNKGHPELRIDKLLGSTGFQERLANIFFLGRLPNFWFPDIYSPAYLTLVSIL